MKVYKGIFVSKSSALNDALEKDKTDPDNVKAVQTIFATTTAEFDKQYPKDDVRWFYTAHKRNFN